MIYPFTAKPKPGRLIAKMNLILGVLTLIIAAMAASIAAANPVYQSTGEWRSYPTPARVTALAAAGDTVWAGIPAGLIRFNQSDGTSVTYTTADGLPGDKIRDIAFDTSGRAWVGAYEGGAGLFDGPSWTVYTAGKGFFDPQKNRFVPTDDGLADADVQAILPLLDGRVWFGTGGGVSVLDQGLWRHYTYPDDGLAANPIESLTTDKAGRFKEEATGTV